MNPPVLPGLFEQPVEPLPTLPRDPVLRVIAATGQKAEQAVPGFVEAACAVVLAQLRQHGPMSGEALTDACRRAGLVPHDDRAFGSVFLRLSKSGRIVTVGYTTRTKGHGTSGGRIWRLAGQ